MMLSLDTTELKKIRIRVDSAGKTRRYSYAAYADTSLPKIIKLLAGKKPRALGVVVGPGAFSATRTGVALLNALSYGWNIPLLPLDRGQFDAAAPLPVGSKKPAAVVYGSLPNITIKKIR
jgi:tRNA A37 threonylcarbamoyladenosine modification protein TsaB